MDDRTPQQSSTIQTTHGRWIRKYRIYLLVISSLLNQINRMEIYQFKTCYRRGCWRCVLTSTIPNRCKFWGRWFESCSVCLCFDSKIWVCCFRRKTIQWWRKFTTAQRKGRKLQEIRETSSLPLFDELKIHTPAKRVLRIWRNKGQWLVHQYMNITSKIKMYVGVRWPKRLCWMAYNAKSKGINSQRRNERTISFWS